MEAKFSLTESYSSLLTDQLELEKITSDMCEERLQQNRKGNYEF